jgi:hypothetical protein
VTPTPLELPGWLEFNAWRTGLQALRVVSPPDDEVGVDAVLYLDRRGRLKLPPNNPYLAVVFRSPHQGAARRTGDWLRAVAPLVEEMKRRGSANQLYLPPEIDDVRPWLRSGFHVGVRYTYYLDFPYDEALQSELNRRMFKRAVAARLTAARTDDIEAVLRCLAESEARQGFETDLGPRELGKAVGLVGAESLRMYLCREPDGEPASACIVLHAPGARALAWLNGGRQTGSAEGASRLLWRFAFDDLAAAGATGIDLSGANIPPVAAFKALWGARLVASYAVRTYSFRTAARFAAGWLRSVRA